jgi:membrane fusion protein, multidrug efflux system
MNPIVFAMRRPVTTIMLVVSLIFGGVLALNKMRGDNFPPLNTPKMYVYLDYISANAGQMKEYVVGQLESYFHKHEEQPHEEHRKIVATSPKAEDVIITREFVCQIHSRRHINVCALDNGYLQEIKVREGQAVKTGDTMFKIRPVLYKAKLDAELAEARLAELEYNNTEKLFKEKAVVSQS